SLAEITATLESVTLIALGIRGVEITLHCEPFQCSTKAVGFVLSSSPTAQTLFVEVAAAPNKKSLIWNFGPGLGLETTLQSVPFQCSVNVLYVCAPPSILTL